MKLFRIILLVFNILAALGLVATTLAGLIAPSSSILPSVLAYGFLPMLVLNLVLVIVWLCMGRWEFLISAGTILLRIAYVGFFFQIGGTSEVPPASEHPGMVTLMSYNLHNFGGKDFDGAPNAETANEFLRLLDEYQCPDILCMQEFCGMPGCNVTDSLKARGYNHCYGARGGSENPSGTVVFSRLPITYVKNIDHQKVLVELQKGNRKFRLCCVHMDSYQFLQENRDDINEMRHGRLDSTSRRTLSKAKETVLCHEKEWKELLHPLVTGSSLSMLLAGDMNDIPGSWLYGQITDHLDDTYRDEGSGFCTTFNGGSGNLLPFGHDWMPQFRIDMVFHSPEFTTLSYHRIKSEISDHYPVLVALELKNEKQ